MSKFNFDDHQRLPTGRCYIAQGAFCPFVVQPFVASSFSLRANQALDGGDLGMSKWRGNRMGAAHRVGGSDGVQSSLVFMSTCAPLPNCVVAEVFICDANVLMPPPSCSCSTCRENLSNQKHVIGTMQWPGLWWLIQNNNLSTSTANHKQAASAAFDSQPACRSWATWLDVDLIQSQVTICCLLQPIAIIKPNQS